MAKALSKFSEKYNADDYGNSDPKDDYEEDDANNKNPCSKAKVPHILFENIQEHRNHNDSNWDFKLGFT